MNILNVLASIVIATLLISRACFGLSLGTVEEPPGNFTDDNGQMTGLAVDFIKEIQQRVGDNSPIKIFPGARLIKYSLTKKNFVIFSLSRTASREDNYHWISLVMRKPLVLFALKGHSLNINSLEDAKKVPAIGVLRKSVQHDFLTQKGFNNIKPTSNHKQNLEKLLRKRISLMFHSMQGAAKLCQDLNIDFSELEPVLMPKVSLSSIAISKNSDPQIVQAWQQAAQAIKDDGTFAHLALKWLAYTEHVIGIPSEIKDGALNFWQD